MFPLRCENRCIATSLCGTAKKQVEEIFPINSVEASEMSTVRQKRVKVDPSSIGNFGKKIKALRNSKNLRFKEIYHPPDPVVVIIFCSVCFSLYIYLTYFAPDPKLMHQKLQAHSEL